VPDEWCNKNCLGVVKFCPANQCDCSEAARTTVTETEALRAVAPTEAIQPDAKIVAPEALKAVVPTEATQPGPSLLPSPLPQPAAEGGGLPKATTATKVTKATPTTRGHYGAEKADDEQDETGARHSQRAKHHKKVAHTKKSRAKSAIHKSESRSIAKNKLLCASSPCLSFCPLDPTCDGRVDVAPVSNNKTDANEEADYSEVDEEAETPTGKGNAHHGSRLSKHRRGTATDAQASQRGHSQRKEDQERKKLNALTDKMAGREEERRESMEVDERKKLADLTAELCAEDPCQVGCPPSIACGLVVSSGIDGNYENEEVAVTEAEALVAVTEEEAAAEQVYAQE